MRLNIVWKEIQASPSRSLFLETLCLWSLSAPGVYNELHNSVGARVYKKSYVRGTLIENNLIWEASIVWGTREETYGELSETETDMSIYDQEHQLQCTMLNI